MKDEFSDRSQAIKLRLAGYLVACICQLQGCTREWFHTWRRHQAMGVAGLYDQTRANHQAARIALDLERTILSIRWRLASRPHPQTRYSLIGASAILAGLSSAGPIHV